MIRAKKYHIPAANLKHILITVFFLMNPILPDTQGYRYNVRALLHESAKYKPEGVEKIELVRIFLRVLDAGVWLFPLVGGEPGQHVDNKGDQDKNQEGADVDLKYLSI
jgi:hypothetical protein